MQEKSWGIDATVDGQPYFVFLVPGIVALTTMNTGFNAIAQSLNVQRIYEKVFEQVMISPTPLWQFVIGQILGGGLRGMYGGILVLLISLPLGTGLMTFFSLERMPEQIRTVVQFLPLSQASSMLREISGGGSLSWLGLGILLGYLALLGLIALICLEKKKNL